MENLARQDGVDDHAEYACRHKAVLRDLNGEKSSGFSIACSRKKKTERRRYIFTLNTILGA